MTRAQIEAARIRVGEVLHDRIGRDLDRLAVKKYGELCSALVSAVLGHPDGKVPRWPAGAGRRARRVAR